MAKTTTVRSSAIAKFLKAKLHGPDVSISNVATLDTLGRNSLGFARAFSEDTLTILNKTENCLIICGPDYKGRLKASHIFSARPGLDFVKAVAAFFVPKPGAGISPTAIIDAKAKIGRGVYVGHYAVVGPDVTIGDGTVIGNNVVLAGPVKIGKNCIIKSNAVIGESGFGFEIDYDGTPRHFPHLGAIEIGNDVWIGAGTCVERAHITKTVIGDNVKIDDLVQIGHNVVIGKNALITSGAVLCGAAIVGKNSWIAPNTTIKEKVKVGAEAFVGLASVVIKDVPAKTVVVGNPARILKKK